MARNNKFRITKNDRAEYKRLRANTNAKIRNIKNKYGIDFTSEFKPPKLESFSSRKEFNEFKKKAQSFTNRSNQNYQFITNKYGVTVSKKEYNELKRKTELTQRLARKKQKEIYNKLKDRPFIIGGERFGKISNKTKTMNIEEITGISVPFDFNFDRFQSKGQFYQRQENFGNRSTEAYYSKKNETLKENFITTIKNGFNSSADDVIEILSKIKADDFLELSIMFDEFDIRTYDSQNEGGLNDDDRLETLRGYLEDFNKGSISTFLKNF